MNKQVADDTIWKLLIGNGLTQNEKIDLDGRINPNIQNDQDQNLGVVMKGPGIDPTGQTDSGPAINQFLFDHRGKRILVPAGYFMTSVPLVLYSGTDLVGVGHRPASIIADDPTQYPNFRYDHEIYGSSCFLPTPNFTGDAVILGFTWQFEQDNPGAFVWFHRAQISNLTVDGRGIAPRCMAIHRLGEATELHTMELTRATLCQLQLSGAHAPCHVSNVTVNGGKNKAPVVTPYDPGPPVQQVVYGPFPFGNNGSSGIWLSGNPLPDGSAPGGGGGSCLLEGISGDGHSNGLIRISGGQKVVISGLKCEFNTHGSIVIDGGGDGPANGGIAGSGGGSASVTIVGGLSSCITDSLNDFDKPSEQVIRIDEGVTPSIVALGFQYNGVSVDQVTRFGYGGVFLRDTNSGTEIPAELDGRLQNLIFTYGKGLSYTYQDNLYHNNVAIMGELGNGFTFDMLKTNSANKVELKAGSVSGGVRVKDASGTDRVSVNNAGVAFNGTEPIAKPEITGATPTDPATQQILSALNNLGLVTDSTS